MYFTLLMMPYSPSDEREFKDPDQLQTYLKSEFKTAEDVQKALDSGELQIIKGEKIKKLTVKETVTIVDWKIS